MLFTLMGKACAGLRELPLALLSEIGNLLMMNELSPDDIP
jgi:hypothetical protein